MLVVWQLQTPLFRLKLTVHKTCYDFQFIVVLEDFVKILAVDIRSDDIAAAVGPVKYFSRSFFGVSFKAIFVILFFVILNKIPLSLNSFLKASNSFTLSPDTEQSLLPRSH